MLSSGFVNRCPVKKIDVVWPYSISSSILFEPD